MKNTNWLQKQEDRYGYAFILPWILGLLFFTIGPLLFSLFASFTDYSMTGDMHFVGLANYKRMFTTDQLFGISLTNTIVYVLMEVPLITILGVLLATLLNKVLFGTRFYRTVFYLPSIMVGIGTYFLWMQMLHPSNGLVNLVLGFFGVEGPAWLADPKWTKPALVLMKGWGVGGQMLLYLARLRSIPQSLYEAAEIDGAGGLQKFFNITLPMLTPVIFFNLIIGIIGSFQIFQEGYVMSGEGSGSPANSLLFYNMHIWNQAFRLFKTGYASALSWFLFFIVMGLTLINLKLSKKWVFYEGEDGNA